VFTHHGDDDDDDDDDENDDDDDDVQTSMYIKQTHSYPMYSVKRNGVQYRQCKVQV